MATRNYKDGWQHDDAEGGYLKKTAGSSCYILRESWNSWRCHIKLSDGRTFDRTALTLAGGKRAADEYLQCEHV